MKKGTSVILSSVMLASAPLSVIVHADSAVDAVIAGQNRYETSVKVSQKAFKSSDYVIIASGDNFPDALSGGVLSGYLKAPILLSSRNSLSDSVKSEIQRLSPKKIYILGGENSISHSIESDLQKKYSVSRISGKDRYETSRHIALELQKLGIGENYAIASGNNFADALSASPAMAKNKMPLVLVNPNKSLNEDSSKIKYVFGGKNSISFDVPNAKRIAGKDRYETAVKVSEEFGKDKKSFILASGEKYQDALSAAALSVITDSPILLTERNRLPESLSTFIGKNNFKFTVVGGKNSVNPSIIGKSDHASDSSTSSSSSSSGGSSSHRGSSTKVLSLSEKKANLIKELDKFETEFKNLTEKDVVFEGSADQTFDGAKKSVIANVEDYKKRVNDPKTDEAKFNDIVKELSNKNVFLGKNYILTPFTVKNTDSLNLVSENAVVSSPANGNPELKPSISKDTPRFSRVKHDKDGKYRFRIETSHKGYVLNTEENKKTSSKLLHFNYVTKLGYNTLKRSESDKSKDGMEEKIKALKVNDTDISKKADVDVVTNPTPRYGRNSLIEKNEINNADIKVTPVAAGYDVEISNLPKDTLIIKPVFLDRLPLNNTLEYGDMIFVDQAQLYGEKLYLTEKDLNAIAENYKDEVAIENNEAGDTVDSVIEKIKTSIKNMKDNLAKNIYPSEMDAPHGIIGSYNLILKPYTVEAPDGSAASLLTPGAISSKSSPDSSTPRFARIKANSDGEYVFKISSVHKGYVLNNAENKLNHDRLLGFTYVTKDNYNSEKIKEKKVYDTVLDDSHKNIDTVTSPTPRYPRANLVSASDIKIVDNNGQYTVTIKNLPENTLIIKPVFKGKLPGGSALEYGDMIFIDQDTAK